MALVLTRALHKKENGVGWAITLRRLERAGREEEAR